MMMTLMYTGNIIPMDIPNFMGLSPIGAYNGVKIIKSSVTAYNGVKIERVGSKI